MEPRGKLLLISDLFPVFVERYEWNESLHPRQPSGSSVGGEFRSSSSGNRIRSTKKREIAALPDTIHEGHSLHLSKLPPDLAEKSRAWSKQLHNLMAGVESAKSSDDEEIAWAAVNKDEIRKLLDQMNSMDKQYGAQTGQYLSHYVNANGLIPRTLAERLDGGEQFFNPEKIGKKLKGTKKPSDIGDSSSDADIIRRFNMTENRQERKRMLNDPVFKAAIERAMGIDSKGPPTPEPKPDNKTWKDDPTKVAEFERRKGIAPSKPANYDNRIESLLQRRDPDSISNQPIDQVLKSNATQSRAGAKSDFDFAGAFRGMKLGDILAEQTFDRLQKGEAIPNSSGLFEQMAIKGHQAGLIKTPEQMKGLAQAAGTSKQHGIDFLNKLASEQQSSESTAKRESKPKKQDRAFSNLTQAHFTKLKNAIADYLGTDSPEHQAALEKTVPDAWRKLNDESEQWNSGLREIVGQAHKNGLGAMMSNVHRVADPMSFKGFDQLVHHAQQYYPHIISHPDGPEEGLMQALKSGMKPSYALTSPEVIDHATNLLGPGFRNSLESLWQSNEKLSPLSNEDREAIPFSVRAMMYAMGLPILRIQSVVT